MKRFLSLLLVVAWMLTASSVIAAPVNPDAVMALKDGTETIYIGEENYVYSSKSTDPLALAEGRSLVYADATVLVFTSIDEADQDEHPGASYLTLLEIDVPEADPHVLDAVIGEAVYIANDGVVYYVSLQNPNKLMNYNPVLGYSTELVDFEGALVELRASIDGLIIDTESGEKLYVAAINQLVDAKSSSEGVTIAVHDNFETLIDASGNLSMRAVGQMAEQATAIDDDVLGATALRGLVYYLKSGEKGVSLLCYDYTAKQKAVLQEFATPMMPELTAAGEQIFAMSNECRVYAISADSHATGVFATLDDSVVSPVLVATEEYLLVYDMSGADGALTFKAKYPLKAEEEIEPAAPTAPAETPAPEPEEPAPTRAPEPVVLTKGSRGDDVKALQDILNQHGYPAGKADGIFGKGTVHAVKYLQYDMGRDQTGTVTEKFLNELKTSKHIPTFEKYVELERGDRGIRVQELQQRLSALGYHSGKADGIYGGSTESALKAFEKESGESQNGRATVNLQKHLFSKNAPHAPKPAPKPTKKPPKHHSEQQNEQVTEDDMIAMVRWMNDRFPGKNLDKKKATYKLQKRLHELGYLKEKYISKVYDTHTFAAVKAFQVDGDFMPHPTGTAHADTLSRLFP